MTVEKYYDTEINLVKERLIDTSLVVSLFSGIPLLVFSIIRSLQFDQIIFVVINSMVFLSLLLLTFFRTKVQYNHKATYMLSLVIVLGFSDFANVGVLSTGYMWMIAAAILAFLYFDAMASIIVLLVSIVIVGVSRQLIAAKIIKINFDFNVYAYSDIVLLIRTLNFILIAVVIVFSIRQITNKFNINLEQLSLQRQNLMNSAIRMRKEIEQRIISEKNAITSEHKFRNIFESSTDPIVIIGKDNLIKDCNAAFYTIVEESFETLIGVDFFSLIPTSYLDFFEKFRSDIDKMPLRFEMSYRSGISGKQTFFDITTTRIEYEDSNAVLAILRDDTDRKLRERNIYSAAMEGEERERLRLSKELHDGLGPLLSTLKIYYEALEKRPSDTEIQKRIKLILDESIGSVKEISNNLSPYVLQNLGVVKALKAFADKIVFAGKLDIDLRSNITERLDERTEITIYRLVTEMLNNTMKHAHAQKVFINLIQNLNSLKIEYVDDGVGFDMGIWKEMHTGIGLFNMKSRIEKMGGNCEFITTPGEGFKMNAEIHNLIL
ncbi:MAG: PAS domain S-box protein [Prolixibacteraceae bacterium]